MVTIKDVASRAGVSVSTASYALNNSHSVRASTRERVLRAAQELDYRPSGLAKILKKQKSILIGALLNDFVGPFYSELIRGIQEVTVMNGYQLVVCSDYGGDQSAASRFLRERLMDAAIVMAQDIPDGELLQSAGGDFPIMVLDRKLEGENIYSVLIDNENGARQAVEYLIQNGCRRIAFLSGSREALDNTRRFTGYRKVLAEHGIAFDEGLVLKGDFTERGGYRAVREYLKDHPLPEAIFSANDEMAIGTLKALEECSVRVPQDVALVGFDDIQLASYVQPKLTTVRRPMYELGMLATHMLFKAMRKQPVNRSVTLSTELVVRDSCAPRAGNEKTAGTV